MTAPARVSAVAARETTPANDHPSVQARRAPPVPTIRVREAAYVQGIAAWLEGGSWVHENACFRPYHGINVRLRERGDTLVQEGVAVVSRSPSRLLDFPEGTRTSNRTEARALCAVAVRGDAWRYR